MKHSESLVKLAPAFAAAQAEIENAHKNATNPHFKSNYADLAEIITTIRPTLAAHKLAVIQIPGYADGALTMDVMLLHESGEWISGTSGSPLTKQDPQGVGSAITYLRRYTLAALCGIAQEDDDGHAASSNGAKAKAPKPVTETAAPPMLVKDLRAVIATCRALELDPRETKAVDRAETLAASPTPALAKVEAALLHLHGIADTRPTAALPALDAMRKLFHAKWGELNDGLTTQEGEDRRHAWQLEQMGEALASTKSWGKSDFAKAIDMLSEGIGL